MTTKPATASLLDLLTESASPALVDVLAERARQVEVHGHTAESDQARPVSHWAWLVLQRATNLAHPYNDTPEMRDVHRDQLVEVAAIALAAVEAIDG